MDAAFWSKIAAEFASFGVADGLSILTLALLECLLSVDNTLVLAILVRTLPTEQRRRALTYGIVGAFVFRLLALALAGWLRGFALFMLVGGGYLIYLAMKHMFFPSGTAQHHDSAKAAGRNFWKVVAAVELTDIAFSIDSITTAVAMSEKLVIIWFGGIIGIIALRYAASFFVDILDRYPALEELAYQLVFFIGIKLTMEGFHLKMETMVFWLMMGVITTLGLSMVYRESKTRKARGHAHRTILESLKAGELSPEAALTAQGVAPEVIEHLKEKGKL
jgi:YkoY family integral membrane protein